MDPKDPNAWFFWYSLSTCCASDASGQELITFLASAQVDMHKAFENIWSTVNLMYEDVERCYQAAQIYAFAAHTPRSIAFPKMDESEFS